MATENRNSAWVACVFTVAEDMLYKLAAFTLGVTSLVLLRVLLPARSGAATERAK